MKMKMMTWLLGILLGCGVLGACAGDKHLGPRAGEAFDGIFAQQAAPKFDPNSAPREPIGEEAELAVSNVKVMSTRSTTTATSTPLLPLSR
jgi:hypothetical protein